MRNKVHSITESRIHGDMYVRFGGRFGETCGSNAVRRSEPSLQNGDQDVKNILALRNTFENTRKQMKVNTLSINALSDNLNFPMLAKLTLKKT
mgnify:CR=1 FL=1